MAEALIKGPWEDCLQHLSPLDVSWKEEAASPPRAVSVPLRVEWLVGVDTLGPLRRVREALDLLALIARVNVGAWMREVVRLWPSTATLWFGSDRREEVFEIGLAMMIEHNVETLVEEMIGLDREFTDFIEYRASVEAAVSALAPTADSARGPWRLARIPVRVELGVVHLEDYAIVLLMLAQIAVSQSARMASSHAMATELAPSRQACHGGVQSQQAPWAIVAARENATRVRKPMVMARTHFLLTDVFVLKSAMGRTDVNEQGLQCLAKLTSLGINVHDVPAIETGDGVSSEDDRARQACSLVDTLRCLLLGSRAESRATVCAETLTISQMTAHTLLPAVISIVQVAHGLHTVRLHFCGRKDSVRGGKDPGIIDEARLHIWRWIAYALFSGHADHQVSRLEIECAHFRTEHLAAIREVVDAPNPLQQLMAEEDIEVWSLWIAGSKFFLFDPASTSDGVATYGCNDTHSCVSLQPAAPKACGQSFFQAGEKRGSTLVIAKTKDGRGAIRVLLAVVRRFESCISDLLQRSHSSHAVFEAEDYYCSDTLAPLVESVLLHSPRLEALKAHYSGYDAGALVPILTAPHVRLKKLSLTGLKWKRIVRSLLEALFADDSHPFATRLEDVWLNFWENEDIVLDATDLLQNALETTRCLHTLQLHFQFRRPDRLVTALRPSWGHDAVFRTVPLALDQKLAFLAAVPSQSSEHAHASELDSDMVTTIFQFAASRRKRTFRLAGPEGPIPWQ